MPAVHTPSPIPEKPSTSTPATQAVVFRGVTKRFAEGTTAVRSIDLDCPGGLITVFVGPSGCGKTTTLRMVNRTITPSEGTITLGGRDISTMDVNEMRRGMGYVIQDAGLFPHRTVKQNVATVPLLTGTPKKVAYQTAEELLERVGLDLSLAERYPYQLSGGQRQRVGVARALAGDPPVLLMDEPFSAVDPVVRGELQEQLLELQRDIRKTIVFVTHDIDEAVRLGDQIAVFAPGGRLAQVAPPEEILTRPADEFVESFIGGDAGVKWTALVPAAGLPLRTAPVATGEGPATDEWRLRLDDEGRVSGWQPPGTTGFGQLIKCRRTFRPDNDHLRAAIDALLLSPCDLAPAVDAQNRPVGVVNHQGVKTELAAHRGLFQ